MRIAEPISGLGAHRVVVHIQTICVHCKFNRVLVVDGSGVIRECRTLRDMYQRAVLKRKVIEISDYVDQIERGGKCNKEENCYMYPGLECARIPGKKLMEREVD